MGKKPTGVSKGGRQGKSVRVKTAKGRKTSSTNWLKRQLNDPYVKMARKDGYRSRAAYKLIEIDDKYQFLKQGKKIVDLGAAPGSWTQVAINRTKGNGRIVGIDLQYVEYIEGAEMIEGDFLDEKVYSMFLEKVGGKVDVVLSDMASASCGHAQTDHIRIMALCEAALDFAINSLNHNGVFVAKVLQGGAENNLLNLMKKHFTAIKHMKPNASRQDSAEMYVIAEGFKGASCRNWYNNSA